MNKPDSTQRGVLYPHAGTTRFTESIRPPSSDLAKLVKQYWSVHWDLNGQARHVVEILPPPAVNLVIAKDRSWVQGLVRGLFRYTLDGAGWLFGVSFTPAGFRPFLGFAVARLTGQATPVEEVFGERGVSFATSVRRAHDDTGRVSLAEDFLHGCALPLDPNIPVVNAIVDRIMTDHSVTRVADIADHFQVGTRTLQRLFREYVGVHPKWVIQRYRLQEAMAQLDAGESVDLAALAAELAYADQAHLARDFKTVLGRSPSEYRAGAG